jgi:hypothetical protein
MKRILVLFLSLCLIFTTPLIQPGAYGGEENTDTQSIITACSVFALFFLAILVIEWKFPRTHEDKDTSEEKRSSFSNNWGWENDWGRNF